MKEFYETIFEFCFQIVNLNLYQYIHALFNNSSTPLFSTCIIIMNHDNRQSYIALPHDTNFYVMIVVFML